MSDLSPRRYLPRSFGLILDQAPFQKPESKETTQIPPFIEGTLYQTQQGISSAGRALYHGDYLEYDSIDELAGKMKWDQSMTKAFLDILQKKVNNQ